MQNNSRTQNGQSINKRPIEDDIKKINNTSARERAQSLSKIKRAQETRVPLSKNNSFELCIVGFGKDNRNNFIDNSHEQADLVPPEISAGKTIPAYDTSANEKKENNTGIIDK